MLLSGFCRRKYVCRRLSVTFVHSILSRLKFSVQFLRHFVESHLLTTMQNYTEIVPGKPLRRGLNAIGVAKYSDVGHVDGYISEMVQDTASGTIND